MRSRTADLLITNQLLYQLSYVGFMVDEEKVDPLTINFMVLCQDWINAAPMKLQFAAQEFLFSLCPIFSFLFFLLSGLRPVPRRLRLRHNPRMPPPRQLSLFRLSIMDADIVTRCIKTRPMTFPVQTVMAATTPAMTSRPPILISSPGPPIRHPWSRPAGPAIPTRQQGLRNPFILPWPARSI